MSERLRILRDQLEKVGNERVGRLNLQELALLLSEYEYLKREIEKEL